MRFLLPILAAAAVLAGCSREPEGPLVLAAASMQEALNDVADAWEKDGHARPVLSFAASSALAKQVEAGAPADIFISADEEWMDALEKQDLIRPGNRADLVGNELVLVFPRNEKVGISLEQPQMWARSMAAGKLALADPEAVPAGKYAKAALETLGLWEGSKEHVVPAENVRAALALVERGEVAFAIVYATDALASDEVKVIARFPAESHPPIRYPLAVLSASSHPDAAAFRAFLLSPAAGRIFAARGFEQVE